MDCKETLAGASSPSTTFEEGEEGRPDNRVSVSTELGLGLPWDAAGNGRKVCVEDAPVDGNRGRSGRSADVNRVSGENEQSIVRAEDGQADERGDQDEFAVGDFVWGKIKSHPWWPAQIYHPSDATEYAGRFHRPGRLLVVYFGDNTFAWCDPSQVKPFGKHFERFSKQSRSRSFLNAVERALDEFGRCVESDMSCACVEARSKLIKPFALNAGIREGVTVPEGNIAERSLCSLQLVDFVGTLKTVARGVAMSNALILTVLKSQLSAFYHAQGWGDLPVHYDPLDIAEPEENDGMHLSGETDFDGKRDGKTPKLDQEDCLTSRGPIDEDKSSSQRQSETAQDELYHTKKQRSVAELMGCNKGSYLENGGGDDAEGRERDLAKSASASKKRKKTQTAQLLPSEEEKPAVKSASQSEKQKKANCLSPLFVEREGEKPYNENQDDITEEGMLLSSPRMRKKSKYLSPPYTTLGSRSASSLKEADTELEITPKLVESMEIGEDVAQITPVLPGAPRIIRSTLELFQEKASKRVKLENKTLHNASPRTPKVKEQELLFEEYNVAAANPLSGKDDSSDSIKGFFEKLRGFYSEKLTSSWFVEGSDYNTYKGGRKRELKDSRRTDERERISRQKDSGDGKSSKGSGGSAASHHHGQKGSGSRKRNSLDSGSMDGASKGSERNSHSVSKYVKNKRKGKEKENFDKETNKERAASILLTFAPGITFPSTEDLISIFDKFGELNKPETEVLEDSSCARVAFARSSDAEKAFNSADKISALKPIVVSYRLRYLSASSRTAVTEPSLSQDAKERDGINEAPISSPQCAAGTGVSFDKGPLSSSLPVAVSHCDLRKATAWCSRASMVDGPEGLAAFPSPPIGVFGSGKDGTSLSSPAALLMMKKNLEAMMSMLTETEGIDTSSVEKLTPEERENLTGEISGLLQKVTKLIGPSSQVE